MDRQHEIRRHSYELRRSGAAGRHQRKNRNAYIPDEPACADEPEFFAWLTEDLDNMDLRM